LEGPVKVGIRSLLLARLLLARLLLTLLELARLLLQGLLALLELARLLLTLLELARLLLALLELARLLTLELARLLTLELTSLLSLELLTLETALLVHHLVSVDGGLYDVLRLVALSTLDDGHNPLAMNDGLDFLDVIGVDLLLHNGCTLDNATHVGGTWLLNVPLNVVDDVVIDLTMDYRLHFNDTILPHGLLDDWGKGVGGLGSESTSLLSHSLLHPARGGQRGGGVESSRSTGAETRGAGGVGVGVIVAKLVHDTRHVDDGR